MSERLNKGISFEIFQEWLINFIHKNLNKEEDVVILVLDIQDTLDSFKGKKCPADPNGEDKNPIYMKYWELKNKQYLSREKNRKGKQKNTVWLLAIILLH